MTKELDYYFSQLTLKWIAKYLRQWKNVAILINKKWYSSGIICHKCGFIPQCDKCSVSISYHKQEWWEMFGMCHICKTQYNMPHTCANCGSENIKPFGMGTQKLAEYINQEFGQDPIIIESTKANSPNKIAKTWDKLKENKQWQIVIWTTLLSTPIKDFKFDLVVFLNADLGLNIPDYNSAEKNFYFLYETFNKHHIENFIVQSFNPEQYSIRQACKMDKKAFFGQENEFRKENNYPPYQDLCVILYKNEIEESLFKKVDQLYKELLYLKEKYQIENIEIYSTPPLIYKKFGKYRYNIILKWENLRNFMDIVYTKLSLAKKWFKIDWKADSIV